MKNQQRSVLIDKCQAPKARGPEHLPGSPMVNLALLKLNT